MLDIETREITKIPATSPEVVDKENPLYLDLKDIVTGKKFEGICPKVIDDPEAVFDINTVVNFCRNFPLLTKDQETFYFSAYQYFKQQEKVYEGEKGSEKYINEYSSLFEKVLNQNPELEELKLFFNEFDTQNSEKFNSLRYSIIKEYEKNLKHFLSYSNIRLVLEVAGKEWKIDLDMAFQEGFIGLYKAIDGFDLRAGNRFSTYAKWVIEQNIRRAKYENKPIIAVPENIQRKINKFNIYLRDNNLNPSINEILKLLKREGFTKSDISTYFRIENLISPLDIDAPTHIGEEDSDTFESIIPDETSHDEFKQIDKRDFITSLIERANLNPKELKVIHDQFGFSGNGPETARDIAKELEISGEYVRQIREKALEKLISASQGI